MWLTRHLDPRDLDGEVSRILVPLREDQRLRLFPGSLHLPFPRPAHHRIRRLLGVGSGEADVTAGAEGRGVIRVHED